MMDWLKLFSILFFVLLWQGASMWLDAVSLPSVVMVIDSFWHHLRDGELLYHLGITLYKVLIAFICAMTCGILIGLLMGRFDSLNRLLDPWLILGLNIPALVVIMLCYIWIGLNDTAAIAAVVINKVPSVVVTIREGVRSHNRELEEVARLYRFTLFQQIRYLYLPQLYPYIIASARNGLSLIWKIVLVVELLGRGSGIGFQFSIFFQFFDIASILAYAFSFIFIIMLIELLLFAPIEKRQSRWRG